MDRGKIFLFLSLEAPTILYGNQDRINLYRKQSFLLAEA